MHLIPLNKIRGLKLDHLEKKHFFDLLSFKLIECKENENEKKIFIERLQVLTAGQTKALVNLIKNEFFTYSELFLEIYCMHPNYLSVNQLQQLADHHEVFLSKIYPRHVKEIDLSGINKEALKLLINCQYDSNSELSYYSIEMIHALTQEQVESLFHLIEKDEKLSNIFIQACQTKPYFLSMQQIQTLKRLVEPTKTFMNVNLYLYA